MSRKKRAITHRATATHYNYPQRKDFLAALLAAGYKESTAASYATGVANSKGTTYKRARALWVELMGGKAYPISSPDSPKATTLPPYLTLQQSHQDEDPVVPLPSVRTRAEKLLERLSGEATGRKPPPIPNAFLKSAQDKTLSTVASIVSMREKDGSTNDKLLSIIEVLISE